MNADAGEIIRFDALTYAYPGSARPALRAVTLSAREGEFVLVHGPSGSGKSTLLRALNGLVPHFSGGRVSGHLQVAGLDPVRAGPSRMSRAVGMVFQDPEAQFVVDRVEDEIAFALENAAVPRAEMHARVAQVLDQLEIAHLRRRTVATLSGGEQQRAAIASALVLRPRVLVLDEPTSQLDDESAAEVLDAVARLNRNLGLTVVISEHRLERVLPFASRMVGMRDGEVYDKGEPRGADSTPSARDFPHPSAAAALPRLHIAGLAAGYGDRAVLRDVTIDVAAGEIVAVIGRNGSGKSTLLKAIVGLVPPLRGAIAVNGRDIAGRDTADICRDVAYLPQNPNALLFADTVRDELAITRKNHGLPPFTPAEADAFLDDLGIAAHAAHYPRDLSVGERQRAALGAVAAAGPALLLLDEPTRGLDAAAKGTLAGVLRRYADGGAAVVLATHDRALIEACADRVVRLRDGELVT